ncbi:hypothetical protein LEP1GSC166_2256 [Leptospira kirschneri]|nr:hypothetical protein LEP1GSC166_2256 [Leptospira kirschneri]
MLSSILILKSYSTCGVGYVSLKLKLSHSRWIVRQVAFEIHVKIDF